jgi:hypothetical protein
MDNVHLIDYLLTALGALLSVGWFILFYALRKNADGVKETAELVLAEKDKTAALVLAESRLTAALVLSENKATAKLVLDEKDKLAAQLKTEYKELEDKFTDFRIMIAREYATSTLVEKIMSQVTTPLVKKLDEIEGLLNQKVDRREFERHEAIHNDNQ